MAESRPEPIGKKMRSAESQLSEFELKLSSRSSAEPTSDETQPVQLGERTLSEAEVVWSSMVRVQKGHVSLHSLEALSH